MRSLESDHNKRASHANEEQIQARLHAIQSQKRELKQKYKDWDAAHARRLSEVMSTAISSSEIPKVLEDATNTVQKHRAERVGAQIRAVALQEELRLVKEQLSEAEHVHMKSTGELEMLKVGV